MFNILQIQERLKDLPQEALVKEIQTPSGDTPQFLILSELNRRKRIRDDYQRREADNIQTVAEEAVTAAGVPATGILQMSKAIAPKTNTAQNTGINTAMSTQPTQAPQQPQTAADGGIVKMQTGGITEYPSINPLIGNVDLSQIAAMLQSGADKEALVANYGADAVREAESMLLPFMKKFIGQMPLGRYPSTLSRRDIRKMEDQGIFGNKSYRDIGDEGIGSVSAGVEDFTASDRVFEPTNIAPVAAVPEPFQLPTENIDAAQQISYQSGKEPFRRFGANYYDVVGPPEGKEMKGDRDRIMARAGQIFPTYLQKINEQINAPSSSVVASEPELSMDDLMAQAQIEREGFGAGQTDDVIEEVFNADPIQDEINRLRAIISNPDASAPEKANAADDLRKLQERIAVTQTGGNIAATVEGQGIELEAPYIMGPFGPRIDPNYKSPGKTGQSIVDQAALQGSEALQKLADTGLYPDSIIREAEKAAKLADLEADMYDINKNVMDVQNNLKNPYLPDDARAELETFLETAQQQKNELVNQTGVDKLFVPPSVENVPSITGGYEGLIDTSPVTIAEQAAEVAKDENIAPLADERRDNDTDLELPTLVVNAPNTDDNTTNRKPITDPDPEGFGSTDARIAKMLSERQKQAESDKWMALAEGGFKMMTSKSPTLFGAFGEGGRAGLKALRASKKGLRDFETDMLKLQTQIAAARIRSQGRDKTSATAYAALERAYSDALTAATQNPTAPNLAKLEELEDLVREARAVQFGTVVAENTNSGVIKTPSAQTG